ncbi:hypothetical protein RP20_CCG016575 [Aedes albopictus]|nr:hypothetical protein RP20_CCG016575 [Aedes albopictus]
MFGTLQTPPSDLGAIPCAISWLYKGINEKRQKSGARFSVRVSALGVNATKPGSSSRDLLAGHATVVVVVVDSGRTQRQRQSVVSIDGRVVCRKSADRRCRYRFRGIGKGAAENDDGAIVATRLGMSTDIERYRFASRNEPSYWLRQQQLAWK